jgi:cellulose synthase/poly-beta-1,6-N-acetylglucosamine synthase-like glycosyltransferase
MSNSPAIPKVSIILPTYNRLGFLEEAVRSITSQELDDWELIVVDDGSTGDYLAGRLKSLRVWLSPGNTFTKTIKSLCSSQPRFG